ncbi:hypothetical protein [Aminobacter sp. MSH1]|uniref:hypothetical protein n=1 Tax=Aminobacter sp. MSH1 TaxID=374606 RepID=UPI0031B8576E
MEEVARLLEAALGPKYKATLGTAYGAGLRDRGARGDRHPRMLIRVEQGKDRHATLSPQLLGLLRAWWREGRRPEA